MTNVWYFIATVVIQLAVGAYVYGRLTERVEWNGRMLERQDTSILGLEDDVKDHERRISTLEGRL